MHFPGSVQFFYDLDHSSRHSQPRVYAHSQFASISEPEAPHAAVRSMFSQQQQQTEWRPTEQQLNVIEGRRPVPSTQSDIKLAAASQQGFFSTNTDADKNNSFRTAQYGAAGALTATAMGAMVLARKMLRK